MVYWSGGGEAEQQGHILAAGTAWPDLWNLEIVVRHDGSESPAVVNEAAGRVAVSVRNLEAELFPFAADFSPRYGIGRLPDGAQLIFSNHLTLPFAEGVVFDADGTPRDASFHHEFPDDLVVRRPFSGSDPAADAVVRAARIAHIRQATGFEPAFIRVKFFSIDDDNGPTRLRGEVEDAWGGEDDPLSEADQENPLGYGGLVYDWVRGGWFVFSNGDYCWCNRRGHVISS